MPLYPDVPCHSKLLLFALQEIRLSICCSSGSSWNGSVWAQNRVLHCLEGCPRVLMSLTFVESFCLPFKRSHFPFVALQAAAGMGVFGPRTVYCIALKDAPGCHEFLLQDDGKWVHVKETTEIGQ